VIAHDSEEQLLAADPHNVVRLILPPRDPSRPGEEYHDAARLLREWQDEGILVTEDQPALYVYEQRLPGRGRSPEIIQRGLIGAVRLEPPAARIVLPHEHVMPGPVRGRRQLMEATGANLEPIFLLYQGGDGSAATRLCNELAATRPPLLNAITSDGARHALWAVTDPAELAAVAADLAPRQALIADGNHRYAAYLQMQSDHAGQAPGGMDPARPGPWDYGLALLVDAASFPPQIGAIHRVIPGLAPGDAVERAKAGFSVTALPGGPEALDDALDALNAAGKAGAAFLVAGQGQVQLLSGPDPVQVEAAMPAERSRRWRRLPTAVLQEFLLARLWGVADDERSVRVVHHDAARAIAEADAVPGGTAVICTSLDPSDVYDVAAGGELLPRKSTSFAPKPRTGLVLRTLATD
jgi:uncharacterized protein (DUF1015 family)